MMLHQRFTAALFLKDELFVYFLCGKILRPTLASGLYNGNMQCTPHDAFSNPYFFHLYICLLGMQGRGRIRSANWIGQPDPPTYEPI